jgi:hypothetical protein
VTDGVEHQFGSIVEIEFLQNVRPMCVNGRGTHRQDVGDLLVAVSFGDQLKDLTFTL